MLRSSRSRQRAQTEPLGALVAVSALIVGVGLYGLYVTGTLPGHTDSTTAEPALEQITDDIEGNGIFRAYEDDHDELEHLVETSSLPAGDNVYVEVTIVRDGEELVVADAFFGTDGQPDRDVLVSGELDGPPAAAGVATRPISVATMPGDVRGGTLTVGVWSG